MHKHQMIPIMVAAQNTDEDITPIGAVARQTQMLAACLSHLMDLVTPMTMSNSHYHR